jgi:hypothetical protein
LLVTICESINSFQKEKVYNPERKIKKIYAGTMDGPKKLQQERTWDENKLLRIEQLLNHEP